MTKVYIGNLPNDAQASEIEDTFSRYGRLMKVWVARRPPGFAFVEFEDDRDAEDAVKALDGGRVCGARVKVEVSHGRRRDGGGRGGFGGGGYGGGGGGGRGGYGDGGRRRSPVGRGGRSRSRSPRRRSRSPPPRRSPSYSPKRRSPSRSRSRSPA